MQLSENEIIKPSQCKFDNLNMSWYVTVNSYPLFEYLYPFGFRTANVRHYSRNTILNPAGFKKIEFDKSLADLYIKSDWKMTLPWFMFTDGTNTYEDALLMLEDEDE